MKSFKISALTILLVVLLATFAKAIEVVDEDAEVLICCVDWEPQPPTFRTLLVLPWQWDNCESGMLGPCSDFLGQICDDDDFCTVDYDENAIECLPFPRVKVANCPKA